MRSAGCTRFAWRR
ncbi:hypothetical protein GQ600_1163 [Phytophthora cactorum]|nr:hypothetical protein GQ600_1163 [Phytophthora cactorum]